MHVRKFPFAHTYSLCTGILLGPRDDITSEHRCKGRGPQQPARRPVSQGRSRIGRSLNFVENHKLTVSVSTGLAHIVS